MVFKNNCTGSTTQSVELVRVNIIHSANLSYAGRQMAGLRSQSSLTSGLDGTDNLLFEAHFKDSRLPKFRLGPIAPRRIDWYINDVD